MTAPSATPGSPVLITGCSTGIGFATAGYLSARGYTVYATARRPEVLDDLRSRGCRVLRLDVTDKPSMVAAVEQVQRHHGSIGTLINNAGYSEISPLETCSLERYRKQFETNVFGMARMCQLALPGMRAAGGGRIVNVGSIGGRFALPLWSGYTGSKHAMAAFSSALRMEVRRFGVEVTLVEPGFVRTNFVASLSRNMADHAQEMTSEAYAPALRSFTAVTRGVLSGAECSEARRLQRHGLRARALTWAASDPDRAAKVIHKAVTARRPRPRYLVTGHARAAVLAHRLLPARCWEAAVCSFFTEETDSTHER
ncbi:SDR family NAD(P)-dependent oxidoreductase [Streptomyces chrestomyceticus]|uniref:SDR family NAD(P)-dependent oxidoreductase n=1 Tax=Streptomyces chrestomyceticus TaxID=68185 RepID=UPI0037AD197B